MISPYIVFKDGKCFEALGLYEEAFNVTHKTVINYDDYIPVSDKPLPKNLNKYVLHAEMYIYGTNVTFADEVVLDVYPGTMVYLSITPDNIEEAQRICDVLCIEGQYLLEPTETYYSPFHATVKDKFEVLWNIIVVKQ